MIWKELKDWCAKHQIKLGIKSIRFSQIQETKQFFDRRPKWEVFEFSGISYKDEDESPLMDYEKYFWDLSVRRTVKAPIFYYKPVDLSNISSYDVELFLKQGKIPSKFFRRWGTVPIPIYTVDDLEKAYTELITYLNVCKSLQNSQDLKNWAEQYKQRIEELDRINSEIKDIKMKYKQSFCKQASITKDF